MSDHTSEPASERPPSLPHIFATFLLIGGTSIGGGVVAYLRANLVGRRRWLDDVAFAELLAISQALPGLNATNMSILVGDRLRGSLGAAVATLGMCLPGAVLMSVAGVAYGVQTDLPAMTAALHGIAAAAVGLVVAVLVQVGVKALTSRTDYVFAGLTAGAVIVLQVPVLYALVGGAALAIWWNRPRGPVS